MTDLRHLPASAAGGGEHAGAGTRRPIIITVNPPEEVDELTERGPVQPPLDVMGGIQLPLVNKAA